MIQLSKLESPVEPYKRLKNGTLCLLAKTQHYKVLIQGK